MQGLGTKLFENIPAEMMKEMLDKNSSLRGYVQGYAAEEFLMKDLRSDEDFTDVEKIPDRVKQKGDISLKYQGKPLTIEVKSLIVGTDKEDVIEGGFSAVVVVKKTDRARDTEESLGTCHLTPGEFDILAISTYSATGEWGYYFIANNRFPRSDTHPDRLKTSVRINVNSTPFIHEDIRKAIADLS